MKKSLKEGVTRLQFFFILSSSFNAAVIIMIISRIIVGFTPNRALSTITNNNVSSAPTVQNRNNRSNSRTFSFWCSNDKLKNSQAPIVTPRAAQHAIKTSEKVCMLMIDPRVSPKPTVK